MQTFKPYEKSASASIGPNKFVANADIASLTTIVNNSILTRNDNAKSDIMATLVSGKALIHIKTLVLHGQWQSYVLEQTDYDSPRQALHDMQFYHAWRPVIESNFDNNIELFVSALNDSDIAACKSAMVMFTYKNVPQLALELALEEIGSGLTMRSAESIILIARSIDNLRSQDDKETAKRWYADFDVRNNLVIKAIPKLRKFDDLFNEINMTGYIDIPAIADGENKQIKLSEAGISDIELALKNHQVELELLHLETKYSRVIGFPLPDDKTLDNDSHQNPNFDTMRFTQLPGENDVSNTDATNSAASQTAEYDGVSFGSDTTLANIDTLTQDTLEDDLRLETFSWVFTRKGSQSQVSNYIDNELVPGKRYKIVVYEEDIDTIVH